MSFEQKYLKYKDKYLNLKSKLSSEYKGGGDYKAYSIVKTINDNYLEIRGRVPDNPRWYYVSITELGLLPGTPYMPKEDIRYISNGQAIMDVDIQVEILPWEWDNIKRDFYAKKQEELKANQEKSKEKVRLYIEEKKTEAIKRAQDSGEIDNLRKKIKSFEKDHLESTIRRRGLIEYWKSELLKAPNKRETKGDDSYIQNEIDRLKSLPKSDLPETISKLKTHLQFAIENGVTEYTKIPIASWELNDNGSYGKDIYDVFIYHSTFFKDI